MNQMDTRVHSNVFSTRFIAVNCLPEGTNSSPGLAWETSSQKPKPAQATSRAWPGLAKPWPGRLGFWLEARASTTLRAVLRAVHRAAVGVPREGLRQDNFVGEGAADGECVLSSVSLPYFPTHSHTSFISDVSMWTHI
jgi:hypothetical protein